MGKATQTAAGKKRVRVISPEEKVRRRAYALARRAANLEEIRRKDREAYHANREKRLEESKRRQRIRRANMTEAEKEKLREYFKSRYDRKRLELLEQKRKDYKSRVSVYQKRHEAYRKKNASALRESNRQWKVNNREYFRRRYRDDVAYRITQLLRGRVYNAIRNKQKAGSAVRDLGCSIDELIAHIERQFKDGWSWENWGDAWHLDHIYPIAAANTADRAQFLAVANWRNLQPLCRVANLKKNAKVTTKARKLFDCLVAEFTAHRVA